MPVSLSRRASFTTIIAVRRTACENRSNTLINVCSSWDISLYHTSMSYPTPTLVTQNDDDPTFNKNMMTRKATLLENELTLAENHLE
jgi:hypothetical protein